MGSIHTMRSLSMIDVGQKVTVVPDKGVAYTGYVVATATNGDGLKAYKIADDADGLQPLGHWHKACDVFILDPPTPPRDEPIQINLMKSFLRH